MFVNQIKRRAFTILELIVALAVTVLMMFLIQALFTATSDGVSVGMALSDVIGAGRAIGDQIERDAREMIGPIDSPPGVLVIVCQKRQDQTYVERRFEKKRSVRMDQIMWIRGLGTSANGFASSPITPVSDSTFSSPTKTDMGPATAIKLWYGHVKKTHELGTTTADYGAIGPNRVANNFTLGRHALYLMGGTNAPGFNHAKGADANATVSGISLDKLGSPKLFHGLSDVAYLTYSGDPLSAPGAMVGAGDSGGVYAHTLWSGAAKSDYDAKALAHMFLDNQRLWVNPYPKADLANPNTWFSAGQVAQMHALLMDNVSDFIVEFAADAVDDPTIPGFDGTPDLNAAKEIIWYGLANNEKTNSQGPPSTWDTREVAGLETPVVSSSSIPGGGSDTVAYVFRHGQGNENIWPFMIRIRYRIQDSRGELLGDRSLEGNDDTSNVGRWFEQIIKVKRN